MGYVYLICDPSNDQYKIGVTRNLQSNRLKKLQTGNPTEMFIKYTYQTEWPFRLEKLLHNKFASKHTLNEWFALDTNDVFSFLDICEETNNTIKIMVSNPFFAKNLK